MRNIHFLICGFFHALCTSYKIIKIKNVISSTFDSCDIVNILCNDLKNSFLIIDEFHNLSENNINDDNK